MRIVTAVTSGALAPGARLPGTREVARDMGVGLRSVAAAYSHLSTLGLVTYAPRTGARIAPRPLSIGKYGPPGSQWLSDLLVAGVMSGFSLTELSASVRAIPERIRLRAVVIAPTVDQAVAIAREIHTDFGYQTSYLLSEGIRLDQPISVALKLADVLVSTPDFANVVEPLAQRLNKEVVIVKPCRDGFLIDWLKALRDPLYLVGVDPRLLALVKAYLADDLVAENIVMVVAGRDDVSRIPPDASTYITEAARRFLGKTPVPGRNVNTVRVLSADSIRELAEIVIRRNRFPVIAS